MKDHPIIQEQAYPNKQFLFQVICGSILLFWLIPLLFFEKLVPAGYVIAGFLTVVLFFGLHYFLSLYFSPIPDRLFVVRLIALALLLRIGAAIFLYYFYSQQTGEPFEYHAVDSKFYHFTAIELSHHIAQMDLDFNSQLKDISFSDRGYNIFLGFIYYLFGPSILTARIINAILGAATVYFVYRLAKDLYGNRIGRSAAISTLLIPNLLLYLGTHLKETLMLFLIVLFLYLAVRFIKFQSRSPLIIAFLLFTCFYLFMFRTILGVTAVLSFAGYAITIKPLKHGILNIAAASVLLLVLGYFMWNSEISNELAQYIEKSNAAIGDNMQFRATRDGGNKYALLAGAPLFLSVILIAPFSSFVVVPEQDLLWMFIGANFIRNIYAFFTIAGIIYCFRKDFRNSSILLYYVLGYLLILANSGFAISERFHLPAVPALLILASVGLSKNRNKLRKLFPAYLLLIIILVIAWNYIKLAGRG